MRRRRAPPAVGGGENGGGARGLGEGGTEAAASVARPDSGGVVGRKEAAAGWARLGSAQPARAQIFFLNVPWKILRRKINKNQKNMK